MYSISSAHGSKEPRTDASEDNGQQPNRNQEVLEGQVVEGSLQAAQVLHLVIDHLWDWIRGMGIIMSSVRILLVEQGLKLFEALHLGVVGISSKRDESRGRRRSVGADILSRGWVDSGSSNS